MEKYEINNFFGVVKDVGRGKQPENTFSELKNVLYNRIVGGLVGRDGFAATSLNKPPSLVTLDHYLTFPVSVPQVEDIHLFFNRDNTSVKKYIHAKPFYHLGNVGTNNNGWVDLFDLKFISSTANPQGVIAPADIAIVGEPTNTLTITNANLYGFVLTNDYYNNWFIWCGASTTEDTFLVKDYTVVGSTITFLLDTTVGLVLTPDTWLQRYYHRREDLFYRYDILPYTDPAGYSTELAVRFSGGNNLTTPDVFRSGWYGIVNRTFFKGSSRPYIFNGSYFTDAECKTPKDRVAGISFNKNLPTTPFGDNIIVLEKDAFFKDINNPINWVASGGAAIIFPDFEVIGDVKLPCMSLTFTAGASEVAITNPLYYLPMIANSEYTFVVSYSYQGNAGGVLLLGHNDGVNVISLLWDNIEIGQQKLFVGRAKSKAVGGGATRVFISHVTAYPVVIENLKIHAIGIMYSGIVDYSTLISNLAIGNTIKAYGTYVYEGFQESEPFLISEELIDDAPVSLRVKIEERLGGLDKRITATNVYIALENGNTVGKERTAPLYLFKSIPITDDSSSVWTFNTTTGNYETYVDFTNKDIIYLTTTWEQQTQRSESDVTASSYRVAKKVNGRVFIADWQNKIGADEKRIVNSIQFTGFSGDGVMCPDIFPNLPEDFITEINLGRGIGIKAIEEYRGSAVIYKDASISRLSTAESVPLWRLELLSNERGAASKYFVHRVGDTIVSADRFDISVLHGSSIVSMIDGNKEYYKSVFNSLGFAFINPFDFNYICQLVPGSGYLSIPEKGLPVFWDSSFSIAGSVVFNNGDVILWRSNGDTYKIGIGKTDNGSAIDCIVDTGGHLVEGGAFVNFKEIQVDADNIIELPFTPTFTVLFETDNGSFTQSYTGGTNFQQQGDNLGYIRLPLQPHKASRYFRVRLSFGAVDTIIKRIAVLYERRKEFGDSRVN